MHALALNAFMSEEFFDSRQKITIYPALSLSGMTCMLSAL